MEARNLRPAGWTLFVSLLPMIAASTITGTGTDTATIPFSRRSDDSSAPSSDEVHGPESVRTVVPKARLERMAADGVDPGSSSAPFSAVAGDLPAASADASGARLIIPAVSLREMLADPTPEGRMASLHEIRAIDITPVATADAFAANETRTDLLSRREATITMKRTGFRVRVSTAVSLGVGAAIVLLGLAFSTTDLAATLAARIHLATADEPIPAATADLTQVAPPVTTTMTAPPVEQAAEQAGPVELDGVVTTATDDSAPRAKPQHTARPGAPRMIHSMPVRLRSPY